MGTPAAPTDELRSPPRTETHLREVESGYGDAGRTDELLRLQAMLHHEGNTTLFSYLFECGACRSGL